MDQLDSLFLYGLYIPTCLALALLWCAVEWWRNRRLAFVSAAAFELLVPTLLPAVRWAIAGLLCLLGAVALAIQELVRGPDRRAAPTVLLGIVVLRIVLGLVDAWG